MIRRNCQRLALQSDPAEFGGLPTGLCVSGFLSNVAMIDVDRKVALATHGRQVAHFRYCDDHVVLARSFDSLLAWIGEYRGLLERPDTGARFNYQKCEPKELGSFLQRRDTSASDGLAGDENDYGEVKKRCAIDPRFPAPRLTRTLALVSNLAHADFDLLSDEEQQHILGDLEHLLLAEFPDAEIRRDTRMAFAAALLSRLSPRANHENQEDSSKSVTGRLFPEETQWRPERGSRTSSLLLKALSERPDKLRLWTRTLTYCEATGYGRGLSEIYSELGRQAKRFDLTARYLQALVLQVLGEQAVRTATVINNPDAGPEERAHASGYLQAIFDLRSATEGPTRREAL